MSIYSETIQTSDYFDIQMMFMRSSLNLPVTLLLYPEPDGGRGREQELSPTDFNWLMHAYGSLLLTTPNGGSWKIPLAGSVILSAHQSEHSIRVTMETPTPKEPASGESSPCHKRTP